MGIGRACTSADDERVDGVVGARRIVVVQGESFDVPGHRDVDRVLDRAVAPPDLVLVLLLEVLRVVDQQVGAAHEAHVQRVFAVEARPGAEVLGSWSLEYTSVAPSASMRNPRVSAGWCR